MKLSKFNFYIDSGDSVYIFNTLSEKIARIPISCISRGCQNIETTDSSILLELQELGMIHEDGIDEKYVYSFWTKKQAHDEKCFKINVFLGDNNFCALKLSDTNCFEDSSAININIFDQLLLLASMLFSYTVEINLINCEKVDCQHLKDFCAYLSSQKKQNAQIRVNFIYSAFQIEVQTLHSLRKIGVDDPCLKALEVLMGEKGKGLSVVFSKSLDKEDDNSKIIHIVVDLNHMEACSELRLIPAKYRHKIHIHFNLCPQNWVSDNNLRLDLPEKLGRLLPSISYVINLGYRVDPIQIIQCPCSNATDNIISVLQSGEICKCRMNPAWTLKNECGKDVVSQLYQHVLSSGVIHGYHKECEDCTFLPWCTRKCLIQCGHNSVTVKNCLRELYEELAKQIIAVWRQGNNEIA